MVFRKIKTLVCFTFAALMLLFAPAAAMAAQVTGAIFTTLVDGSSVNHNIYNSKQDVFLNGGPNSPSAPCTAAGLPNGDYYFQVTDPSGKNVLSTDSLAERKVRVSGGIITVYLGTTHRLGVGKCGSITVQLTPFNDTPNPGGEYKVWMTPVESFKGFLPSKSKTDNFKAPGDSVFDSDNDGLTDDYEMNVSHTDPFNPDTDGDGLMDGQEVNDYHTNPLNPDSDNDGIWDGDEVSIGTNPLASDTDGGGISDGDEITLGTNPLNPEDDFILQ
jgi:thrombospondin type 3 repeat protein